MKRTVCILMVSFLFCAQVPAQPALDALRAGNRHYQERRYEAALGQYEEALKREPGNFTALFNRANTLYKLNRVEEAAGGWAAAATGVKDRALLAKAYYNQGVQLAKAEKLPECIEAFRQALRNDPADSQARENLQKAMLEWKKKQPPPKKENKQQPKPKPQPQPQPQMKKEEAEQRLRLLEQKEKQVQQRMQQQKNQSGGSRDKDW